MKYFLIVIGLFVSQFSSAQYLLGMHTEFDDTFKSWDIVAEIDSTETILGQLVITWTLDDDFTEWQYNLGDISGEIRQKFLNNPSLWELRQADEVVTIKQQWPGDVTQWVISSGNITFTIQTTRGNLTDEWQNTKANNGELSVYTQNTGDARDWIIQDYMNDDISFAMRFAATFIAIYTSSPKA